MFSKHMSLISSPSSQFLFRSFFLTKQLHRFRLFSLVLWFSSLPLYEHMITCLFYYLSVLSLSFFLQRVFQPSWVAQSISWMSVSCCEYGSVPTCLAQVRKGLLLLLHPLCYRKVIYTLHPVLSTPRGGFYKPNYILRQALIVLHTLFEA